MSTTTYLNEKSIQKKAYTVLTSNDIFNEMVAGGQYAIE